MAHMDLYHRGVMNSLINIAKVIPHCVKSVHPEDVTIEELLEYDFVSFYLYLCLADAKISEQELKFLNGCYPIPQSVAEWKSIAIENDWLGKNYLQEVPASLPLFVEADNFLHESNSTRAGSLTAAWCESFDTLGKIIAGCEETENPAAVDALKEFMVTMNNFIAEYAMWM